MKNTTILMSSNFGKGLRSWRMGLLVLYALLSVTAGYSQGYVTIGTEAAQSGAYTTSPVSGYYNSRRIQVIYTAAEISAAGGIAGNIQKLAWDVSEIYGSGALPSYTVKMKHISTADIPTTTFITDLTTVKNAYSYTPVLGFNDITFDTAFNWNGTDNVLVDICFNSAPFVSTYGQCWTYGGVTNSYRSRQQDGADLCGNATANQTLAVKPRVRFYMQQASCLSPTALAATGVTNNTATLTWTASTSAPANGYEYYYSAINTAPTAASTGTAVTGTTASLSGLTSNTPYYVWVRSDCDATTSSAWGATTSFTTPCDATTVPYTEDFESVTTPALPSCTTTQNVGAGTNWSTASSPGSGFTTKVLRKPYSGSATDAWFFTRGVSLTAGTSYRVTYKYGNSYTFYTEKMKVYYGASNTAAGMANLLATHASINTATPTTNFVDFIPTTTGVYYVGFEAYSSAFQDALYLDNISVTTTPTCEAPTAVVGSTVSPTTASVAWTASTTNPANGYEYYYSTSSTAPTATTVVSGSVAAGVLTASLSGLTGNTTYYVWVRGVCSTTDRSEWAGYSSFYTGYCTPAPISQDNNGITNVVLGTISNATGSETGYYGNYSAQSTSAAIGSTVSFAITFSTGYTYGTKIWIDWNDDLDFTDAGELVYTGLSAAPNPSTLSGTFMVPVTAPVGSHRVRIGGTDNDTGGDPCYTGSYGTYEDYTIATFLPPAPVITSFTPASYCAASGDITIVGTDLGNATLSIGGTAVTTTSNTTTQIVATVPAGVSGTVSVTTVSGTSTTASTFVVNAPATFTLSDDAETICSGNATPAVTVTAGAASFDTYIWSPSTGVTGNATTGFIFNPTATTTYTLTASQSAGPCVVNATYVVTVNPLPNAVAVTPSEYEACLNEVVTLTASGGESIVAVAYCSPTVTNVGVTGDYINNFTFSNITNNGTGDASSDYTYYSGLTANVTGGSSYTITLQPGNPTWSELFRVWIDYNHDGVFSDSESVYNSTTGINSSATATGTVVIPATAINGVTRMRALCTYNTGSAATNGCSWAGYGEYEDYNVNITGATNAVDYVWSPVTGLYTDAAATVPYTGTSASVVYAKPTAGVTYSATATTSLGCPTSGTSAITVTVTPAPASTVTDVLYTVVTTVSQLDITGTAVQWYTTPTGGTALAGTTELETGTYYATQTLNGCESQTRFAVNVTVILPIMDWINLQWPPALTIPQGTPGTVYAQGYEPGVTPGAGPGIGVTAWIGVSSSNSNPSTWTTWVPMTFNTQVGDNDEFMAQIGGTLAPGTYYYASRFKLLDGPYRYGGYNAAGGSFWDGTTYVSGVLTVQCATAAPTAAAMQTFCTSGTVAGLVATGTGVQWYAAATGGTPLAGTTALVDGATYYASQTVGCESIVRTAVMAHISITPAPTGSAAQTIDTAGTVSGLTATGTGIQWYAAATGGTALAGTTALVDGTTYYASQTIDGCESPTRFAVTVTITAASLDFVNLQWPGAATIVEGSTATVFAQAYEAGVTPGAGPGAGITGWIGVSSDNTDPSTWTTWIPMTFSSQAGNNDEYMAAIGANLTPGTYYYASQFQIDGGTFSYGGYNANGGGTWNGTTNVSGVLTVLCLTNAPFAEPTQVFCNAGTVASLTAVGDNIQWYDAATGGTALSADTAVVDGMTYYASQTVNGCESADRTEVAAYVFVIDAPTGDEVQEIAVPAGDFATVEDIVVESEGTVVWYLTAEDAAAGTNALPQGYQLTTGTTYYGVTTVDQCSSTTAIAVTVDIVLGNQHFDMASFSYYPNPVKDILNVSYSSEISAITVFDLLGQKVITLEPSSTEVKVDMKGLAEGTYIMNVTVGNTVKTIKIVKKQ